MGTQVETGRTRSTIRIGGVTYHQTGGKWDVNDRAVELVKFLDTLELEPEQAGKLRDLVAEFWRSIEKF